ncbi:proline-rich receptor-like protein kinase PERK9 [Miscanthus floridulus]|uniref:proline-rich receptor-like protein kinase PERK9 n=1 Tax=Miscanthus floridulus TaxID=154761 RepID=UPI00345915B4
MQPRQPGTAAQPRLRPHQANRPRPAADCPGLPVGAAPNLPSLRAGSSRKGRNAAPLCVVGSVPPIAPPAALNRPEPSPAPPCCPPPPRLHARLSTEEPPTAATGIPRRSVDRPSARTSLLRAASDSFFPLGPFSRAARSLPPFFRSARQLLGPAAAPSPAPQPRAAHSASPAQQPRLRAPGNRRALPLTPGPLSARPNRSRRSSREAATAAPLRVVGACPPSRPGRFKSAPSRLRPSLLPSPLSFARSPSTEEPATAAAVISELRRPPLRADSLLRAASDSFSPLVSFTVLPSTSRYLVFSVFVGFPSFGRELRRPWSPAMAATALAPFRPRNGMAATPFSPRALRVPSVGQFGEP